MFARLAVFEGQPERFVEGHKYTYVLDALGEVPGFQRAYHLRDVANDRALSISFFDDEASARVGEVAVANARLRLGLEGSPPTSTAACEVVATAGD